MRSAARVRRTHRLWIAVIDETQMRPVRTIEVVRDQEALAVAVAEQVVAQAQEALAARGRFLLALAGGSTPRAAYAVLAAPAMASRIDWTRTHIVWSDERCVPPDDPRSNFHMARETLLDQVEVAPTNWHRIHGEEDPRRAAEAYERYLRELLQHTGLGGLPSGRLDLVLLGMGFDGHTASLFPGSKAVRESVKWVVTEYVEAVAMWRITLTPLVINDARNVSFVVSGIDKADRVAEVLEGPQLPNQLPAQIIAPVRGQLTWLLDRPAASRLGTGREAVE